MAEERNHEKKLQQVGPEKITAIINVILGEVKILKGQLRLAVEWASPETRLSLGTGVAAEVLGWATGSYSIIQWVLGSARARTAPACLVALACRTVTTA